MDVLFSGKTDIGKERKRNEDHIGHAETQNGHLYVVCDGMGGHSAGDIASKTAVDTIIQIFDTTSDKEIPDLIYHAFQAANDAIMKLSADNTDLAGMGTTVVVLVIKEGLAFYGNLGDSRLYLFKNQTLKKLTTDHSFVQALLDKGIIDEFEAEIHPRRNEITKALGIDEIIEPDISREGLKLYKGDILMLCSDGLFGMLSQKFMANILGSNALTLSQKCEELVKSANDSGGTDNISVQLIEFFGDEFQEDEDPPEMQNTSSQEQKKSKRIIPFLIILIVLVAAVLLVMNLFRNKAVSPGSQKIAPDTTINQPIKNN